MFTSPSCDCSPLNSPAQRANQQLQSLNLHFLQLLGFVRGRNDDMLGQFGLRLTAMLSKTLASCDLDVLQRMSECGFCLYSLNLHCSRDWQHLAECSARAVAKQPEITSCENPVSNSVNTAATLPNSTFLDFMNCAVFFTWHLAQHDGQAARFMLGMSDASISALRTMDLKQCRYIAVHYRHLLRPRWQYNRYFWPNLLRYGLNGEAAYLQFVRILGTQLIAQDLEPSALAFLRLGKPD
ncbi:MAG: hypothetical protein AB7F79_00400 [Steroidobacteraceae bacterium]